MIPRSRRGFSQLVVTRATAGGDDVLGRLLQRAAVRAPRERVLGQLEGRPVRARLAAKFSESRLVGGEELTSVAWGLAARAREAFSAA
jgi:hypothetical protein